jgi:hypothetical protein
MTVTAASGRPAYPAITGGGTVPAPIKQERDMNEICEMAIDERNAGELTTDELDEASGGWSLASLAGIVGVSKLPDVVAHAGDGVQLGDLKGTVFNPIAIP